MTLTAHDGTAHQGALGDHRHAALGDGTHTAVGDGAAPASVAAPRPRARADRPTVSFELFPPRTPAGDARLLATIRELEAARPDFVSVTYGASGRTRATTRALLSRILTTTSLTPIAHLTCVETSREETVAVIEEFLDAGVRAFLALRGDPPAGVADWRPHPEGLRTSSELVRLLREVEAARCARSQSAAVRGLVKPLSVAVAAFPRGNHATGGSRADDVASLLSKQRAGADFAITQVFWDAPSYLALVAEARAAGVTIPIVPGILTATDPQRVARVAALTGVPAPAALLARLAADDDPERQYRAGLAATADLVRAVLDGGAPGIHVYTFNQHGPALDLLVATGLAAGDRTDPNPAGPHPDTRRDHPNPVAVGPARVGPVHAGPAGVGDPHTDPVRADSAHPGPLHPGPNPTGPNPTGPNPTGPNPTDPDGAVASPDEKKDDA